MNLSDQASTLAITGKPSLGVSSSIIAPQQQRQAVKN
jgi:hypothetical protein